MSGSLPSRRAAVLLRRLLVAAVLLALLPRSEGIADDPPPPYTIVDLGILPGATNSMANSVNNRGQVVGRSGEGEFGYAFYWNEGIGMQDLGTLPGGSYSEAFAINDSGQITGSSQFLPDPREASFVRAFLWLPAALPGMQVGMNELGTLGGKHSEGRGINVNGQVVGTSGINSAGTRHAFRTDAAHYPSDLGTIAGVDGDGSVAYAVNSLGQVVGTSQFGGGQNSRAFRFFDTNANGMADAGEMVDLGTLPGGDSDSSAVAINNAGVAVGVSRSTAANRAVVWNAQGQISALPALPGYTVSSYALGINNGGTVVGAAYKDAATAHAFLYKNGVLRDLNDYLPPNSGWVLIEARSISDNGQIAGLGEHHGLRRAFLLKPLTISSSIPPAVDPCHTLTYTLTYRNAGTEPVNNVVVRNRLPKPTTFISAQAGGLYLGGEVVWQVGALAPGASGTVTFTVAANDASVKIVNDYYTVEADGIFYTGGPHVETPVVGTGASIVDIGTLNGTYSTARGINNSGQVAGISVGQTRYPDGSSASYEHALLWSANGGAKDLGTILGFVLPGRTPWPAARSFGLAINDSGQVAGWSYHVPYDFSLHHQERVSHPFVTAGGEPVDLIVPAEDRLERNGEAYGINNAGHACGYFSILEPDPNNPGQIRPTPPRSCLWKAPDQMTDLGTLGGPFDGGRAYDVNASDQVVGYSDVQTDQGLISRAYLWEGGTMTPLFEPGVRSIAFAINDKGQVVGQREWPDTGWTRAFLWSKEGGLVDLLNGFASPTTGSDARAINNAGQVVGAFRGRAFLWDKGHAVDLNDLIPTDCGWFLRDARGINEQGQITGEGDHFGLPRGFVLTPKPDQPPVLTNPKAAPSSLPKAGGPVTLTVNATDDRGLVSARVEIAGPDGSPTKLSLTQTSTERVTAWQGSFPAPPNPAAQPRKYTVTFFATDTGGHEASAAPVSFTVAAGSTDRVPPVLSRAAVQPPTVPAAGKKVVLSVTATDNKGVAQVSAAVAGPVTGTVTLRKVSGSNYRGEFPVPRNRTRKKLKFMATFSATDTAGNAARPVAVTFAQQPR